jgi:hypothetical protein
MYQGHQGTLMQAPAQVHSPAESSYPDPVPGRPGGHRRTALVAEPGSIAQARDFTADTLRGWRLDGLVGDAVMVASELVTNAIRHGTRVGASGWAAAPGHPRARVGLAWSRQASRVICIVTDRSTDPPRLMPAGPYAESGRGLQIVRSVATAWGWTLLNSEEKAVWAAFRLPPAGPST